MPSEELLTDKSIVCDFECTPEHLTETLARYRSQHRVRGLWTWIRILFALFFLLLAFFFFRDQRYVETALFVGLTVFIFISPKLDDQLARRRLTKSPHYNTQQTFTFSQSGVNVESEIEKGDLNWNAFQRAVIFDDGVLLFRGMGLLHWVPYQALDKEDSIGLQNLISANIEQTRKSR